MLKPNIPISKYVISRIIFLPNIYILEERKVKVLKSFFEHLSIYLFIYVNRYCLEVMILLNR